MAVAVRRLPEPAIAPVRRVTPMRLVDDVDKVLARYQTLGFTVCEIDTPGCRGIVAEDGGVILISRDYALATLGPAATAALSHGAGLYVWMYHLDGVRAMYDGNKRLFDGLTDYGTHEIAVLDDGVVTIFSEFLNG